MTQPRGFTLLELIVAMTILGLISLSMLGGLRFGATAWQRSDAQGGAVEQIELAESVLRNALRAAYPYFTTEDPTNLHVWFQGSATRLDFLAPSPQALGGAGLARFSIAAEPGGRGIRLTVSARPELATADFKAQPPSVLVSGLDTASFSYFGADAVGSPATWHESWAGQRSLPAAIRISGAFPAGDARHWPDLVIVPQIAVDETCMLDLLSHRCQGR